MEIRNEGKKRMGRESWQLDELCLGVVAQAEASGVGIRPSLAGSVEALLSRGSPTSRLGRLIRSLIPVLEEADVLVRDGDGLLIPYDSVGKLTELGIDALDDLVPWAPFALYVEGHHHLGSVAFRYTYGFFWGHDLIPLERRGWFVRRGEEIFRLDPQTYLLVEAMERWNAAGDAEHETVQGLLEFAKVKGLAEGVGAQLDRHLQAQNVVVPPRVGVDLIREADGRISFAPKVSGVPATEFREVFFAVDTPDGLYSVADDSGRHYQVVFDDQLREVVRRIWKVRHLGGEERDAVLRSPEAVFDGVLSHVDLDLSQFSERVVGVGPLLLEPKKSAARTGVLDGDAEGIGLKVRDLSGAEREVRGKLEEIETLAADIADAKVAGRRTVSFGGQEVAVDSALADQVGEVLRSSDRGQVSIPEAPEPSRESKALLIRSDEEEREYEEGASPRAHVEVEAPLPDSLVEPGDLKPHQVAGIRWLLRNLREGRHGCLLADDMGLGKTLQLLTFIAAVLQNDEQHGVNGDRSERIIAAGPDPGRAPWNPVLIVAPVILLENKTWQADMERFFQGEGATFLPWIDLRGSELRKLRRTGAAGRETQTGLSHLDIEKLTEYRVVLTNYETVVNYQFSLGQVPWSIVVTDEAQEYKTPSTRVSQAMKALKAGFRVAATGTPVETSLEDVWNIFDFLEPSTVLGSLKEFRQQWVQPVNAELSEGRVADLSALRKKLGVGERNGRVLRREKTDHVSLPPKTEMVLTCDLSEEQVRRHEVVLERARTGGEGNHPLSLIHQLVVVSQHPALWPQYGGADAETLIATCPKLQKVLETLDEIRRRSEKALIFTRSIPMQQILRESLRGRFGIEAGIINGQTGRDGEGSGSRNSRKATLDRFRRREGFDTLILSPDVAGLGLTIVEANHVIHYGRWWNPAKELQATDRAYRIGQDKEVFVYYPVAGDPRGRLRSFDQMLDELLRKRKELSKEFLRPGAAEDQLGDELAKELFSQGGTGGATGRLVAEADLARLDAHQFEALVSAIEEKRGRGVILTPTSGDEGIDVVSIDGKLINLLRCRHDASGGPVDKEALEDLRRGLEGWVGRRVPRSAGLTARGGLVASGPVTKALRKDASSDGIAVWDGAEIRKTVRELSITHAALEAAGARRASSMAAVQSRLAEMVGAAVTGGSKR